MQFDNETILVGCSSLNQQNEAHRGRNRKGFTVRTLHEEDNQINQQNAPRRIYPYLKGMYDFDFPKGIERKR